MMSPEAAVGVGISLVILALGIFLIGKYVPAPEDEQSAGQPSKVNLWILRLTKAQKLTLLGGVVVGLVFFAATGWMPFVVVLPVAGYLLPSLFSSKTERNQIARLEDMESWTRSLGGLVKSGSTLETALRGSLISAGTTIRQPISNLVARLDGGWRTKRALRALADDLDDPTGDLLVMHLTLAATQRGSGLIGALEELAEAVQEETRIRRQISADRTRSRQHMRFVVLAVIGLLGAAPFIPALAEGYNKPMGQIIYLGWVAVACVLLWRMFVTSAVSSQPRLLEGGSPR